MERVVGHYAVKWVCPDCDENNQFEPLNLERLAKNSTSWSTPQQCQSCENVYEVHVEDQTE